MRDQQPINIENFMGLFDRGPNENCPYEYFTECRNIEFLYKGFRTRGEFTSQYTFTAVAADIIGLYIYPRVDGTSRRMVLVRETGGAQPVKLYDIDHPTLAPFLVATYTTDINALSTLVMFDRFYFAPLGALFAHIPGEIIAVYDGTNASRDAGGLAPNGATMTSTEPGAGDISAGTHLFAVAFETPSGYITKPGPAVWTKHVAAGSKNANLAGILTGPAGTVARHILATKLIPTYTDPQENFELFFVPGGKISDNVTTTLTVNFFDTELVNSADYLIDQIEEIPAGPLFSIGNSLAVAGYRASSAAEDDKRSVVLISKGGEVESFAEGTGFVIAKPGYGGNLNNGLDLNGTLYLFKDFMTLMVQPDPNLDPVDWAEPAVVDSINGTGPFGIGTFMGVPFIIDGGVPILTRAGLQFFNGSYVNLSDVIDDRWLASSTRGFNTSILIIDPIQGRKRAYILLASASGTVPDIFLVADFKLGFSPDKIRWSEWVVPNMVFKAAMNDRDGAIRLANTSDQIIIYNERAGATTEAIVSYIDTALFRFTELGYICQFGPILIGAEGVGPLEMTWKGKDDVLTEVLPNLTLSAAPGKYLKRLTSSFTSPMARLHLETDHANQAGSYMSVNTIKIFGNIYAEEYPE